MDPTATGSLSIKFGRDYYTLAFPKNGWLAIDMLQFLDDVLGSSDTAVAILKLLGYTLEFGEKPPGRNSVHWVEIDLGSRRLVTNSNRVRRIVDQSPTASDPHLTFRRIHEILDRYDFTVEFHSDS